MSNTVCDKHAGFARYRLGGCIHVGSLLVNRLKVLVAELKEARPFRAERSRQQGEFPAAIELRRRFPGIVDNEQARLHARIIASWGPLPEPPPPEARPRSRRRVGKGPSGKPRPAGEPS